MRIAYVYPGLRYKTGVLKNELSEHPAARRRLERGSAVLGREITALCQRKQPFASTAECFVVSLALQAAAGMAREDLKKVHINPYRLKIDQ